MLLILVSIFLIMTLLTGIGRLFSSLLGVRAENPLLLPWLGFFFVSTASMGVSCFMPLNIWGAAIFVVLGLTGLLPGKQRPVAAFFLHPKEKPTWAYWLLCLGVLALLSSRLSFADWPGLAYDTDLYHANAVRWMNDYGTPPGLATLHSRLGFNSSWLTFAALLDNGPLDGRTAWMMPALPLLGIMLYLGYELFFGKNTRLCLFAACAVPFVFLRGYLAFPNLYYDSPSFFFNMIAVMECIRLASTPKKAIIKQSLLIVCLAAASFTIKPIGAVCVLFSSAWISIVLYRHSFFSMRNLLIVFALPCIAGLIWMGKNALLSGYLLFPAPLGRLPVPWVAEQWNVVSNYEAVIGWARAPGAGYRNALHGWEWLYPWFLRNLQQKILNP